MKIRGLIISKGAKILPVKHFYPVVDGLRRKLAAFGLDKED